MGAIKGRKFEQAVAKILPELQVEIVKRSDQAKGFKILPRNDGWSTNLRLAWTLSQARQRLRDLTRIALTFVKFASIWFMMRRPCKNV